MKPNEFIYCNCVFTLRNEKDYSCFKSKSIKIYIKPYF